MSPPFDSDARRQLVRQLAGSIRQVETAAELGRREAELEGTVPLPAEETSPFKRLLPNGQLPAGGLLEVLTEGGGSGGVWLALHLAVGGGAAVVLIDVDHELYPPALAGLGFDFTRTIVVRPKSLSEGTWAFEQALRCPGVGAVWCRNQKWNDRVFRRLQLAAEAGGGLGLVSSPAAARKQPSWAETRWLVTPVARRCAETQPGPAFSTGPDRPPRSFNGNSGSKSTSEWPQPPGWRLRVESLQARGGVAGGVVELEICDETGAVRLVSPVATATAAARAARA